MSWFNLAVGIAIIVIAVALFPSALAVLAVLGGWLFVIVGVVGFIVYLLHVLP